MRRPMMAALMMIAVLSGACGRRARPSTPMPSDAPTTATPATPAASDVPSRGTPDLEEARRRAEEEHARVTVEQMVFFDFDRADIREDARPVLAAKLPILREHPEIRIRIEGHADERGSVEYNLALSLRRAVSVQAYLEEFGISRSRMEVVAFGEERPLDGGTSEPAFARNRRAEFRIVAGLASSSNR